MTDWRFRDEELKHILHRNNDPDNEGESVAKTVAELIPHLKANPCYADLPKAIITQISQATTFHSFNRVLDKVYDFADGKKIWLGFMPLD
jgi:hypothetical protein